MITDLQPSLFDTAAATRTAQEFLTWKEQEGAGKVISLFYKKAAGFFRRYQTIGVGVSQRLLEELTRDEIRRHEARGVSWQGYTLNSHFTAHIVRHMLEEHPEWKPMFELREIGARRNQRKVLVIQEPIQRN